MLVLLSLGTQVYVPPVAAQNPAILYHERPEGLIFAPRAAGRAGSATKDDTSGGTLSFTAFGRRFEVMLERNRRLTSRLPAGRQLALQAAGVELYSGVLSGLPGSWARLTRRGSTITGAIWDGNELYALEPFERAAPYLLGPGAGGGDGPIIYRLSDTVGIERLDLVLTPLGDSASVQSSETAPLATITAPATQVDVAFIGDAEFALEGGDEILLAGIANIVDGIFSQQVGVYLNVTALDVDDQASDSFTTNDPAALLGQLGDYKAESPTLSGLGLVHLVTGRDLTELAGDYDRQIVGIANLAALCDARYGVGLTQNRLGLPSATALIAAHEIGHNFGAPHDAEAGSPCATTSPDYLMNPTFNNSRTFSACSIEQMQPVMAGAACLAPVPSSDVALRPVNAPTEVLAGENFVGTVAVDSLGINDATAVSVEFKATGLELASLSASGIDAFDCRFSTNVCWVPRIALGASKTITFTVGATQAGTGSIEATAAAGGDTNPDNDYYRFDVDVIPTVHFTTNYADAVPTLIRPGDESEVVLDFVNIGLTTATNVKLQIGLDRWFDLLHFSAPGGASCAPDPTVGDTWLCPLQDLPLNVVQRVTIDVRARAGTAPQVGEAVDAPISLHATADQPQLSTVGLGDFDLISITANIANLSVEMENPNRAAPSTKIEVQVQAQNSGPDDVDDVVVYFHSGGAFTIDDAGDSGCTNQADFTTVCQVGLLTAGETVPITFSGTATGTVGPYTMRAEIKGATYNTGMPFADGSIIVDTPSPAPPPPSPSTSASGGNGGGGGSAGPAWLLALLSALAGKTARSRRLRPGTCGAPRSMVAASARRVWSRSADL